MSVPFSVAIGCPMCGTNAEWPDSPACECGWVKVAAGADIDRRPHLRLVGDVEPSAEDGGKPSRSAEESV